MALNGLFCADVPLRNYSLTHSRRRAEGSSPRTNHFKRVLGTCRSDIMAERKMVERIK